MEMAAVFRKKTTDHCIVSFDDKTLPDGGEDVFREYWKFRKDAGNRTGTLLNQDANNLALSNLYDVCTIIIDK
ncbi:hypothetical protein [uncultured Chryseobacterium sp.]|uniref:hypothetical protein n=2 Tax=uncultured Chryseobacterium sp. TaxID=259322 RepID=UPI0025D3780B|nr:hypothetical protein [uncultured Chryseobacterium sp.]